MIPPTPARDGIHGRRVGLAACPVPKPHLLTVRVDGETVVYDPRGDRLHLLESTASLVWSRLDGDISVAALSREIASVFAVEEAQIRHDVLALMDLLWDQGLLAGSSSFQPVDRARVGIAMENRPITQSPIDDSTLPDAPWYTRCVRALQHVFDVATNDPSLRDYFDEVLGGFARADEGAVAARYELLDLADTITASDRERYLVRYEGEQLVATHLLDWAISMLLWHVNAEVVSRSTPSFPIVHAAAAVSRGVAVLLPAPAESGKTTTVAGLLRAGFGYLTDEAIAIDPETLMALPYPKSLSVDGGSWEVLADLRPAHAGRVSGQWQVPPQLIRPNVVAGPSPVRFIVIPAYRSGAATELERMSRAQTLMSLADSTFHFPADPQRNLAVLKKIVVEAQCFRLTIGDLDRAVEIITELVGSKEFDVTECQPPTAECRH